MVSGVLLFHAVVRRCRGHPQNLKEHGMSQVQRPQSLQKAFEFRGDTLAPLPPETHECVVSLLSQLLSEVAFDNNSLPHRSDDDERED